QFRQIDTTRRAHSLYLEMAAELGVLGLGLLLSIFGVQLAMLGRARRVWRNRMPEFSELATALSLSLVSFLGTSLFLHLSYQRYLWLLLAICSAAIAVLAGRRSGYAGGTGTESPLPQSVNA